MDDPNWAHWEQLAAIHGRGSDRYYDLDALIAGATLMGDEEAAALQLATGGAGVADLDVLHLQCHLGCDAITLARLGARVTAVDFSPTALRRCRELAGRCAVEVRCVEADAQDLPDELEATADLVYASIGALCWIESLDAWMAGVARVLRPGGRLVLVDFHPLFTMFGVDDPPTVEFPYLFDGPQVFHGTGSYAQPEADVSWRIVQFAHGVGEVVTAALGAGLSVSHLVEHAAVSRNFRQHGGPLDGDGRYRFRLGPDPGGSSQNGYPLPVLFTLVAAKAGSFPGDDCRPPTPEPASI